MARTSKLEFYKDKKKQHRWRLVASNGDIIACSGEGYTRKENAEKGWISLCKKVKAGSFMVIDNYVPLKKVKK